MIGTAHDFQGVGNPWEQLFREMLASVVNTYGIQIIRKSGTTIGAPLSAAPSPPLNYGGRTWAPKICLNTIPS